MALIVPFLWPNRLYPRVSGGAGAEGLQLPLSKLSGPFCGRFSGGSGWQSGTRERAIAPLALTLLILVIGVGEAKAQTTRNWNGLGGDNNWMTAGNWSGGAPVAGDDLNFAGNIRLGPSNNFANLTAFRNISFAGGASAFTLSGNSITLNGSVTNNSTTLQTSNLAFLLAGNSNFDAAAGSLVQGGILSGSGGITKLGGNTLTLSAANTHTGLTTVSAGTLALANVNALRSSTLNTGTSGSQQVTFTVAGTNTYNLGGLAGNDAIALGTNSLSVGANNQSTTYDSILSSSGVALGTGDLTKVGTGTLTLSGANTYTGVTTFAAGIVNAATLSDYGVAGSLGQRAIDTNPPASNIGLRFLGGTLQYTGATAQSTNRDIRVGLAGGTIDASGSNPSATMSFTKSSTNADIWDSEGPRTLTLTGTNTGNNLFAINWQGREGAGNASKLVKSGSGTWVLTNSHNSDALNNSYNAYGGYGGGTVISGGTLAFASGAIGGGVVDFTGNATLRWEAGNTQDITTGTGGGTSRSVRIADGVTATFNTNGNNVTLSNAFALGPVKSGALTKTGAGTLTLTASNTYTGATTVSAGTLLVNNTSGSGTGTGTVTVASGATLGGSGVIGGNTTIQSGGTHAPGNAVGVMTHLGNITYNTGSTVQWELTSQTASTALQPGPFLFDQIKVNGNLNFAGATTMALTFNSAGSAVDWSSTYWDMGATKDWLVYEVGGTTNNFGGLSLNPSTEWLDKNGVSFDSALGGSLPATANFYLYQSGKNIFLRYEAVPEPVGFSLLALALGLVTMIARPRRRILSDQ